MNGRRLPKRDVDRSDNQPKRAGPIIAQAAPRATTCPHAWFASPDFARRPTCSGSKMKRMNHLKLVANQNALVQRYQAGVSEKLLDDAWEGFIVASHSVPMFV